MRNIINKIRRLYETGGFHITAGTFATKFVSFFGSVFVVRILSKPEYGILGYVDNVYSYAFLFAGFGLCYASLRYIIKADEEKKKAYYDYVIKHSIIRDSIIAGFIIIINFVANYPNKFIAAKFLVPVIAFVIIFQDLINNNLYSLRALFRNKEYAFLSFFVSILLIFGRIIGAFLFQASGVIWSRLIINVFLSIYIWQYVVKKFNSSETSALSKEEIKEMNIYSIQYMITNGLWAIFMLNDTFLLGTLMNDPSILADYKVAYVLPGNLSIFATSIGTYIGPYFTKHENEKDWIKSYFWKTLLVSAGIVGFVSLFLYIFAEPIIVMIYGETYRNTVYLMRVLLIALFINSGFRYVVANILASLGIIKYNMIVSLFGVLLSIILDIALIGKYGSLGVAYSSVIAYSFMTITLIMIFYKRYI